MSRYDFGETKLIQNFKKREDLRLGIDGGVGDRTICSRVRDNIVIEQR
jgi:hypothetical protein